MRVKEIISIDFLRILSGFFVVFIHSSDKFLLFENYVGGSSWWLIYILNTLSKVSVPLFIMVSGYLLLSTNKTKDIKNFYKRRFTRVGIPLVLWISLFFIYQHFIEGVPVDFAYIINTVFTVALGPLYFLIVIVELYLLTPFIQSFIENKNLKTNFWIIVFLALFNIVILFLPKLISDSSFNYSANILTIFLPYVFYFVFGGFVRRFYSQGLNLWLLATIYIAFSLVTAFIAGGDLNSPILAYASPTLMLMSVAFFMIFVSSEKYFKGLKERSRRKTSFIAGTIFGIFLVHSYVINIIEDYTFLNPGSILSPLWLYVVLVTFIVFVTSFVIVVIGKRIPGVKMLFG